MRDGLSGTATIFSREQVRENEIERILATTLHPQEAADALVAAALEGGARDNVTVVVLDARQSEETSTVDVDTAPRPQLLDPHG